MKAYNSRTHLECIINLFWIYTPFYSTCRPHEFRKAVKQVERAFWQVIYRSRHRSIWKALKCSNLHSSWPVCSCTWHTQSDILVQVALLLWSLLTKTQHLNWQLSTSTQSYWSFHTLKTWSGRVFSGSWIWTKYVAWFRKNTKYLGGKRYLIATQEAGFTKI